MEPDAVNCPDNWHCCPRGTQCSTDCNFRSCKCLFPTFHRPAAAPKLAKEAKDSKMKSKSHSESHSASGKVSKESVGMKKVSKTKKRKKKKNKAKDTNATKSQKKANGKLKHKHKLKDKKNKKHKQRPKDKGRKKTKTSRSKAKDKGGKSEKLKKFKKKKAIHKINKHVVKVHRTYQPNNFHPTAKQHWKTLLDDSLGAIAKHKPNIKFSHTWGKRKHQKLSFKSNGKKSKGLRTDASMADELKHLIVKHRKEKLRKRLKLRVSGHAKHKYGSHRNGFINRRKSPKRKKEKGRTIHPTHTRNIFKHGDSNSNAKHKNVKARKISHKVKAANKMETNKSRHEQQILGPQNLDSVNVFNNLRQTLHEKVLAKANISIGLNPTKHNGKIAERFATNTSDNKTDELGMSEGDIILKSEKAMDSSKDLQRTSSSSSKSESQQVNSVKLKEMSDAARNASASLVENSLNSASNSSSDTNESEPSNSAIVSVSNVVTKEGRVQPQDDGRGSRKNSSIITKPNSTQSGIDEKIAEENRSVKADGKVKHGTMHHNETLATIGAKNVSSVETDSVPFVIGMGNQAKADWVEGGSGFEAHQISMGSASGLEMVTAGVKNVSTADTKSIRLVTGMHNQAKPDWVGSGSELEADHGQISIGSESDPDTATAGAKNVSRSDTKSALLVTDMHNQAKADWIESGSGLENDEFSIGSASGQNIDEHIKVFLGGEDIESSTTDLEENETTNALPLVDSSSESLTDEDEGSSKTSPRKSLKAAESADAGNFSGSGFDTFSSESGSDVQFGGEGDHGEKGDYEEKPEYDDQKYFYSSGKDDSYQSGLFPLSETTSLKQWQKLKTTENKQSIEDQNEDSSSDYSLSNDLSQMTYNDWDDANETYSGLGGGLYESSTDQSGTSSGVNGFSSESFH